MTVMIDESRQLRRMVGAWLLAQWCTTYSDGRAPTYPFGRDAQGLLTYSADGHMSALIQSAARPALSGASAKHSPAAERLAAFDGCFAYAGRFSVQGAQVTHHVTLALNPNFIGSDQVRTMTWEGDTQLTLSADDVLPGTQVARHHALVWRKAG
jgi:hypothetical protein